MASLIDTLLVISTFLNVVLTSLLVYLYWKMQQHHEKSVEIQKQQANIMESQERLESAKNTPILQISRFKYRNRDTVNSLALTVTNTGNGIARDVRLGFDIYLLRSDEPIPDKFWSENGDPLLISDIEFENYSFDLFDIPFQPKRDPKPIRVIASGESDVKMDAEISAYIASCNERSLEDFESIMNILERIGVGPVVIQFTLIYRDMAGEKYHEFIDSNRVEPECVSSLSDVAEQGDDIGVITEELEKDFLTRGN